MVKVKAIIKDDSNSNFESEVYANINSVDFLVYKDCMDICSSDEYGAAYDRICACFQNQNRLPYDWYFYSDIELAMEDKYVQHLFDYYAGH